MHRLGRVARFTLSFGLLFGAGGAALADLEYSFATPGGVVLELVETDFIQANYSVAPYQLDANGGSGFFDETDATTFYFSSVIPANQSQDYVGLQVALAAIPTAIGQEVPIGDQPLPEPATWTLMALGLAGLAMVRRRSRGA